MKGGSPLRNLAAFAKISSGDATTSAPTLIPTSEARSRLVKAIAHTLDRSSHLAPRVDAWSGAVRNIGL